MGTELYRRKRAVFGYIVYKYYICNVRRFWVHPYTDLRLQKGRFQTAFSDLRENPENFFEYFRMSVESFDELSGRISDKIKSQDTHLRLAIPPVEMLAVTLRYLGSGCDQVDLHLTYRIGHSTIGKILRKVCKAIWDTLVDESFPQLTEERWLEIAADFQNTTQFPNCLGAVDGKHVRIKKPGMSGSLFYNYKNYFSVVLLAVADANYNFIYIDVGAAGRESDSTILENTDFYTKIVNNEINIPKGQPLPGTVSPNIPYTFIADEAFSLSEHITRPYSGKVLTKEKRIFNYRLSRGRRYVESTFGILSNKWKIFHKPMALNVDFAKLVIKTCCSLHNFVRKRDGYYVQDATTIVGVIDIQRSKSTRPTLNSIQRRNTIAKYFLSDVGLVPWQESYM